MAGYSTLIVILSILCSLLDNKSYSITALLSIVSLSNGAVSLTFLYIPEAFNTELRVIGISMSNSIGRTCSAIAYYFLVFLVQTSK